MSTIWNEVYFVGQVVMRKEAMEKYRGWNNYRIEYYSEGEQFNVMECGIWLPEAVDIRPIEDAIWKAIKDMEDTQDV